MRVRSRKARAVVPALLVCSALASALPVRAEPKGAVPLNPGAMRVAGQVDERYLSYNVEAVELTGGSFWAPYPEEGETQAKGAAGPEGVEFTTGAYQIRPPIDLGQKRLRTLTRALGPAYVRVSGSWANSTFFQDDDEPSRPAPSGYQRVLTRAQWAGLVDFARAVDAKDTDFVRRQPGSAQSGWVLEPRRRAASIRLYEGVGSRNSGSRTFERAQCRASDDRAENLGRRHGEPPAAHRNRFPGYKDRWPWLNRRSGLQAVPDPARRSQHRATSFRKPRSAIRCLFPSFLRSSLPTLQGARPAARDDT